MGAVAPTIGAINPTAGMIARGVGGAAGMAGNGVQQATGYAIVILPRITLLLTLTIFIQATIQFAKILALQNQVADQRTLFTPTSLAYFAKLMLLFQVLVFNLRSI
ncbi:MAG: hypothetical protein EZS28_007631 [Streblomastix strix]|uniref:Uncharacterized protein n=1 Tax=Streblomastix strix TaxID=222440 RepID=A0A5J4WQM0_9EUKA|nr:MAG: hypothetical protein EZS28_007631 [Streblomastix strix]